MGDQIRVSLPLARLSRAFSWRQHGRSDTGLTAACSVVSGLFVASTWEIRYGSHCRLLGCLRPLSGVIMAVKCLQIFLFIALAIIAVNGEVREKSDAEKTKVDLIDHPHDEVAISEKSKEKREALPEAKRNKDKKTKKKGKRKSSGKKNQKKKAQKKKKNKKSKAKRSKSKRKTNKKKKKKKREKTKKKKKKKKKS